MKKHSAFIAIALVSCLGLAACTSSDGGDGGGTGGGSSTVQFYTDKAAWEPQFDDVSALSKTDIDVSLAFTGYSDSNTYTSFIKQALRTNEKPDLFTWHTGDSLKELVDQGLVQETTEQWKTAIDNGDVPADLADYYTYDGKQYCMPLNSVDWVMYYNKKVFADNGIEVPTTWDDMIAASQTLKDAGVTPFYQTNQLFSFVWFQTILAGMDPDAYAGLSTGETKFTDPVVVEAMDVWRDMMDKGYFIDPGVTDKPSALLQSGQIAMIDFGSFLTGELTEIGMENNVDYGIFVIPAVDPSLTKTPMIVETAPMCQAAGAKDADATVEWTNWWMTEPAQNEWAKTTGSVSFNPKAEVHDEAMADVTAQSADFQLLQRFFEAVPAPVLTASLDAFGAFITTPSDPMPYLQQIQDAADQYWAEQG